MVGRFRPFFWLNDCFIAPKKLFSSLKADSVYLLFLHIGANEVDDVRSDAHRKDSGRNWESLLIIADFLCVCYFLTKAEYLPFRAESFGLAR